MKHKGEGMFGEKILPGPGNPQMRYSIQDPKSPFYPNEPTPLDNRRFDSEPAIKHKAYPETHKPQKPNSLTKPLQKPKANKEDHKETLSEIRRREEEDFQTDDKPSEIEDRKLNSSEDGKEEGFTQYGDDNEDNGGNKDNKDKNMKEEEKKLDRSDRELDNRDTTGTAMVGRVDKDEEGKRKSKDDDGDEGDNNRGDSNKLDGNSDDRDGNQDDNAEEDDDEISLKGKEDASPDKTHENDDSRAGDLTQERLNDDDENVFVQRGDRREEVEKALDADDLDNDDSMNSDDLDNADELGNKDLKRTLSEKEQPLEEVIKRKEDLAAAQAKSVNGDSKIHHASDDRGSKETTNGVLETPPPEDFDEADADVAAVEINRQDQKPRVFYSDKSESSVESMMADTPSNYNIPNGRFEDKGLKGLGYGGLYDKYPLNSQRNKSNFRKPNLDVITEVEAPTKAPSNLNTIKHLKTTKNERNFIDSVLGSDKNSYLGDAIGPNYFRGGESDRGPGSDHNPISAQYNPKRHSKSNLRGNFPSKSLEQSNSMQARLKYNQFMMSNNGSEDNSGPEGFGLENRSNLRDRSAYNDPEMTKEIKSGLPPIRYPKLKKKVTKKKKLKLVEDKNLSLTSVNDLESAYLSGAGKLKDGRHDTNKNFNISSDKFFKSEKN